MKLFKVHYLLIFTGIILSSSIGYGMYNPQANLNKSEVKELTLKDFEKVDTSACGICFVEFENHEQITRCPFDCKTVGYHPACLQDHKKAQHEMNYAYKNDNSFPCPSCRRKIFKGPTAFTCKDINEFKKVQAPVAPGPKAPAPSSTSIPVAPPHVSPSVHSSSAKLAQCSSCKEAFKANDYISQCPHKCPSTYHHICLIQLVENSIDQSCPTCKRRIEMVPDGTPYQAAQDSTTDQEPGTIPANNPQKTNTTPITAKQPFITPELISEGIAALIYGIVAQHLWASPHLTKSQRWGSLGGLGASLIVLQNSLNHGNPARTHDIEKRLGAWLGGIFLGFTVPWFAKKLDQKYAFFRSRATS